MKGQDIAFVHSTYDTFDTGKGGPVQELDADERKVTLSSHDVFHLDKLISVCIL